MHNFIRSMFPDYWRWKTFVFPLYLRNYLIQFFTAWNFALVLNYQSIYLKNVEFIKRIGKKQLQN